MRRNKDDGSGTRVNGAQQKDGTVFFFFFFLISQSSSLQEIEFLDMTEVKRCRGKSTALECERPDSGERCWADRHPGQTCDLALL